LPQTPLAGIGSAPSERSGDFGLPEAETRVK